FLSFFTISVYLAQKYWKESKSLIFNFLFELLKRGCFLNTTTPVFHDEKVAFKGIEMLSDRERKSF
ncbi:hypothetical protein GIB67_012157, partial [Kingdonia uniflora]